MWARNLRLVLLLIGSLLLASGCDSPCQELCTSWFDYQQDVCGTIDTDDARVACISDYRDHLVAEEETAACAERIDQLETLRTESDPTQRRACCEPDSCSLGPEPHN